MTDELTSSEFIEKFDSFTRAKHTGNVIIHPALPFDHIELTGDFVNLLKNDLEKKIMMAHTGLARLSPTDKFTIMILEQAY